MAKRQIKNDLKLVQMDEKDWRLESVDLPESEQDAYYDVLDTAFSDFGGMYDDPKKLKNAETKLRKLIKQYPNFIDGYHHLAMLLEETGRLSEARLLWEQAVNIGMQGIIDNFCTNGNKLKWGWLDNRPFLRSYHSLGLQYMKEGNLPRAIGIFNTILQANPSDNQGIRALLVECYFEIDRPTDVLRVCMLFPDDTMEDIIYGKALALFKMGKMDKAEKALSDAVRILPKIAAELIKRSHKRPAEMWENTITHGGNDQAYSYWERQGYVWKNTPGAIDFVKAFLKKRATASI